MKHLFTYFFLLILSNSGFAQTTLTQTVRGNLVDFDTKLPIYSARIVVPGTEPIIGCLSDENGEFRLENVPVGRISLRITAVGFEDIYLPNLLVESGKEKILNLEMTTDIKLLDKVEVSANQQDKSESINKMATVSAKTFTVEETNRYAGSLNDPARMVAGFAGVVGDAEGDNNIVVRGNSPRGILWRLEGIDIPNPNHFAGEGTTGGPVNALNGAMLANSDFFSGAFAPEYGNALSGVFDVKFRQGNNEKREYSFSAGVLGIDGTLEGPFKNGYRGSYLVNYRYSSIALLDKAGILDFDGIPIYQDASFKLVFPTKKAGTFSLIGLGGTSKILQTDQDDLTGKVYGIYDVGGDLGVIGLTHRAILSQKMYIKSYLSATTQGNRENDMVLKSDSSGMFQDYRDGFRNSSLKAQSILNFKLNAKNTFQVGGTFSYMNYDFFIEIDTNESGTLSPVLKSKGTANLMQSFVSWKYRISNKFSIVSGINHTYFFLNKHSAIEPRIGAKWDVSPRQNISVGFGMHSRLESISTYLYNELQPNGSYHFPNKNMDFSKSVHYVLGYGVQFNENLRGKIEVYYQHLYNLPVKNDSASYVALVNSAGGIPNFEMVNKGTGRNYGIEFTLERYFSNNFYYLATTSLYKSEYRALDGIIRSTRFDGNYAMNFLVGKEFKFVKARTKTFGVNSKISLVGGNRYTPVDLAASQDAGYEIRKTDLPFSAKGENVFLFNLGLTYRVDMKRASHSFKIDIQNLTNHQAKIYDYYDSRTNSVEFGRQLSFVPNLIYTIKF